MIGLLKLFVILVIVVVTFFTAFRGLKRENGEITDIKVWRPALIVGALLFIGFLVIAPSVGIVSAGHRGVVLRLGAVTNRVLPEGIFVVTPALDTVKLIDVRVQAFVAKASSASKDLQEVSTDVTVNYYLDPTHVNKIFQTLRLDWENKIIVPGVQEAVKASTARYNADEIITKRPEVKSTIEEALSKRLSEHNIIVDTVNITEFQFSKAFTDAIEAKVTAVQKALEAENVLKKVEWEAKQKIAEAQGEAEAKLTRAKAEAEAIVIQGKALRENSDVVQLRAIEKWSGILPVYWGGGLLPFLDIGPKAEKSN